MGKNKKTRRDLAAVNRNIAEHELKIKRELSRATPNEGRILHWEAEIRNWKKQRQIFLDKLPQNRRRR